MDASNSTSSCTTGNYGSYSTQSASDVMGALGTNKRYLDATSKESPSNHEEISSNLVETLIKGESMFDEQLEKFCEGQPFPSLRIEGQITSKGKEKTSEDFGISGGGNKLLVKDEFLAAIRDDLAEEYQPLCRENKRRISEDRRKYLAEKVANATADAAAAAERHWRINNTKLAA